MHTVAQTFDGGGLASFGSMLIRALFPPAQFTGAGRPAGTRRGSTHSDHRAVEEEGTDGLREAPTVKR